MPRYLATVIALGIWLAGAGLAWGQETPEAKATRKRLQEKITVEIKETPFKEAMNEISRELNNRMSFKIDNISGLSNNSKVTVNAKDKTVEAILNELADKYEFGYFIMSNAKDRLNGWVILRKHKDKERGYEAGKEPKKDKGAMLLDSSLKFYLAFNNRKIIQLFCHQRENGGLAFTGKTLSLV